MLNTICAHPAELFEYIGNEVSYILKKGAMLRLAWHPQSGEKSLQRLEEEVSCE